MKRSFKYRIYPNKDQVQALDKVFYLCRFLYNSALEERISSYEKLVKSITHKQQRAELKGITDEFPEYKTVFAQTRQEVLKQLDMAYQHFFRRVKEGADKPGFPRFKGRDRFRSICFPQVKHNLAAGGFGMKKLPNNKLRVFGIPGDIKVKWHRPFEGRCKQARIVRQADQWYLALSCDDVPAKPQEKTGKTTAYDLGLTSFLTADDGTKFRHPKPWKTAREKLAYHQRKLALKKRGSRDRDRQKTLLQRAYAKTVNVRQDFQHKLANKLIKENDVLILEKLDTAGLLQKKDSYKQIKSGITDAAWGNFVTLLLYKAESAGREIKLVNPKNTSKMCSQCGTIKEDLQLSDRTYQCGHCGVMMDRDRNAALNIRRLGMSLADGKNRFQKSRSDDSV